ncbi:MAG: hypothetical protein Greene07147_31 [Parcubacteria group bacterium Greene0714_7]|nr:MAG: hypothetical protein Greene07147_31 [Parcubacteria group bacterium Greene0714_7]
MMIHPAFVHFPLALLTLYVLLELVPFSKFFPKVSWDQVKYFLLYIGTLSIFPAILTGLIAEDIVGENVVLSAHKAGAMAILLIFLVASLLALWNQFYSFPRPELFRVVQKLLAIFGMIALVVQGVLGAAMVYGYSADPITSFISSLFGFH